MEAIFRVEELFKLLSSYTKWATIWFNYVIGNFHLNAFACKLK